MKTHLNNVLKDLLKQELNIANERNRKKKQEENNFIKLVRKGDDVVISLLENDKEVITVPFSESIFGKIFDFRNSFIASFDILTGELTIVTNIRLHGHTGYSLLDGTVKPKQLAKKTEYSCAITDHGVLYGAIEFHNDMKKLHKKPIIGFEAYTENINGEPTKNHLILLAKNEKGYKNISMLSSLGHTNIGGKFPQRPLVKHEWLKQHSEGVICLSACIGGEIPKAFLKEDDKLAYTVAESFKSIYGEDFYIEIQRHYMEGEEAVNNKLIKLAKDLNLKVVATDDAHYLNEDDAEVHEVHLCNQTKKTMSDPKRMRFPGRDYFVHTTEQMEDKFKDIPEALYNTLEIMDKCEFEFHFAENIKDYKLPKFPVPNGETFESYLRKMTEKGFQERFPIGTEKNTSIEYRDRLEYELSVIEKMGYASYFLIVWDFVRYAKENEIPTGPGRGSACGSLVAYCLKITNIDPIPYGLLFERFLNPDRMSMPDWNIYSFII